MAILWMDGFDHYAGSTANMLLGVYANVSSNVALHSGLARSGGYGICNITGNTAEREIRRVIGGAKTIVGIAFGCYADELPASGYHRLAMFGDTANGAQVTVFVSASGTIRFVRGSSSGSNVLADTASPVISAGVWNHCEMRIVFSNTVGAIELRVNEVSALTATGLDTVATANVECSQITLDQTRKSTITNSFAFDDVVVWDTSGSNNNDFIGDRRVLMFLPNANEATQEMTVTGAANAYTAIQSADGDTSYITASDSVPVTSEFAIENPAATVGAISAIQTVALMRKTEAGAASVTLSMLSNGDVAAGTAHSITDSYAYYADVFETNPDTGAPWNASALQNATMRIRRTV